MVGGEKSWVLKCPSQLSLATLELSVLMASQEKSFGAHRAAKQLSLVTQLTLSWLPGLTLAWVTPGLLTEAGDCPVLALLLLLLRHWGQSLVSPPSLTSVCRRLWTSGGHYRPCCSVQQDKAGCRPPCTALQLLPETKIFKYIFTIRELGKKLKETVKKLILFLNTCSNSFLYVACPGCQLYKLSDVL